MQSITEKSSPKKKVRFATQRPTTSTTCEQSKQVRDKSQASKQQQRAENETTPEPVNIAMPRSSKQLHISDISPLHVGEPTFLVNIYSDRDTLLCYFTANANATVEECLVRVCIAVDGENAGPNDRISIPTMGLCPREDLASCLARDFTLRSYFPLPCSTVDLVFLKITSNQRLLEPTQLATGSFFYSFDQCELGFSIFTHIFHYFFT